MAVVTSLNCFFRAILNMMLLKFLNKLRAEFALSRLT